MSRRAWWPPTLALAALALHQLLLWAAASHEVAAQLLSPGAHASAGALVLGLGLVLTRLGVVLLLPALAAAWLVLLALRGKAQKGAQGD